MDTRTLENWIFSFNYKSLIIIAAVVIGMLLLRWIILTILKKLPKHHAVLRSIVNWFTFYGTLVFLLLYFSKAKWMFAMIFRFGKVDVTLFLIIVAVLIITLASRLSKISTNVLLPGIYNRYHLDKGTRYTFDRVVHYSIMIIAIIVSLTTVGINLSALTVFAGMISVGIGFGLQNITSNFISGVIILFERPIKVGDRVLIDNIIGDVEKINMRATVIKTGTNEHIIVPNSYFLGEKVVNRSFSDPKIRLTIPFNVAYGTDVEKLRDMLMEIAREESLVSPAVLMDPEPSVSFVGFGDFCLNFELSIMISDYNQLGTIKSNINFRINKLFTEKKIEFPYPQRNLIIKNMDREIENNHIF
ncbi:mechanosensitive ion channel family protein [Heyndrickxia oleronia]|jgi:potassium efflux system protein|uniref:mechanosensitive ion channel family protein n=1 Tax=Heyndrickxia oleronia TaxID=38875 RepID=UPI00242D8194|nr:mechanosensitive ion channel domain-containing protein [Heyndrickxia oleronia]MCI1590892.1 mechanosensitive ion channel [Heyndrickxia oleronia]MCI1615721.1 mechanosensitive ion channel [Heyndrickxia oleronia]MCI1746353.1 mechanosensitive ion channel [Heyndrickxia oleronia]MCI1760977.1 mechanosensitive ion channel [Heyndrickxia oleronia]